jgi:pyridoxamine--pyruvate transaminase
MRDHVRPGLHHNDPVFIDCFARTVALLQRVFATRHDVVVLQGETVLGMEAVAASLLAPGDQVLTLVSGVFGKWCQYLVTRAGAQVVEVAVPYDDAIDPADVRKALAQHPRVKALTVVHAETPSGTVNPIAEICRAARDAGVLTIVDTALGLGAEPFRMDEWGIDIAVSGPQKCLGGLPGLALIAASSAAWDAMEQREQPLRDSYLSLLDWRDTWVRHRAFPYTPSISLIYGLESVLSQVMETGIERCIARHQTIGRACRAGVRALGFDLWPRRDEIASNAATVVKTPPRLQAQVLIQHMRSRYGVAVSGGYKDLAGKTFRLGHMGYSAHPTHLAALLAVLERSLADLGVAVTFGAGVGSAMREVEGWE